MSEEILKSVIHKFKLLERDLYFLEIYKIDEDNPCKELRKALEELSGCRIEVLC